MKQTIFQPVDIISDFDSYLDKQSLSFEAIIVGGAALALLKIINRGTRDVDLLTTPIPPIIEKAARDFALLKGLSETWLNNAPSTLARDLPKNWENRTQLAFTGKVMTLWTLDRQDLIISKLYAACDRQVNDVADLLAIKPTDPELDNACHWVSTLDANPDWPKHVFNVTRHIKNQQHG